MNGQNAYSIDTAGKANGHSFYTPSHGCRSFARVSLHGLGVFLIMAYINKERRRARQRERYLNDPDYRLRIKKQRAAYYLVHKSEIMERRQALHDKTDFNGQRAQRREEASHRCKICGAEPSGRWHLNTHHKDEDRSNNAPNNLLVVCPGCHSLIHHYGLETAIHYATTMNHNTIILHCRARFIEAVTKDELTGRYKSIGKFTTIKTIAAFLKQHKDRCIMRSSDMDFPEEYTDNKRILALARAM